jgi:protease-4
LVAAAARQVSTALAADRGLAVDAVLELIDRAPLNAIDALAAGLVDRLGYRDEVYAAMRRQLGGDVELRYLAHYAAHPPVLEAAQRAVRRHRRRVGLIEVSGNITLGPAGPGPFAAGAGSDRVCAALRAAGADDDVRAVVLRVDSPGGSYVASDAIWRATLQLREAGKPLVVSMARLAASGGYYVSMSADRIVALPATLTGSIGVFGGKLVIADLLGRLGIGYDAVGVGRNARQYSPRVEMDEAQLAALNAMLDRIYADFTTKVASARGLDPAAMDAVARGRVWTGDEAIDAGLVDELGGLARAGEVARTLAGLPADAPLRLVPTPGLLDAVRRPRSSADDSRQVGFAPWNAGWGSWATLAAQAGLPRFGPLSAPPVELIG